MVLFQCDKSTISRHIKNSIDYSPNAAQSQQFFQVIKNKMHWTAHGIRLLNWLCFALTQKCRWWVCRLRYLHQTN